MIRDPQTGWIEATVTINGNPLSFAEAMTLRVAVGAFLMNLADPSVRAGLGEGLAGGYQQHLRTITRYMQQQPKP